LRARLPGGSWRQWVVPAGIQVQFCHRLGAPIRTRPHDQPGRAHSTVLPRHRVMPAYFHAWWCPWGAWQFCRKVRFLGQNPKIGYRKFNDLQTAKLSKKQLGDSTFQLGSDKARSDQAVSSSPPFKTELAAFTALGLTPSVLLRGPTAPRSVPSHFSSSTGVHLWTACAFAGYLCSSLSKG
jgi:hypothetical protein